MNRRELEAEMVRKGFTCAQLAQKLGMNRSTFSKKINGVSEFKQSEIEAIIRVLGINDPMPIFFSEKVS